MAIFYSKGGKLSFGTWPHVYVLRHSPDPAAGAATGR